MTAPRHVPYDFRFREVPDWAQHSVGGDDYKRYCRWLAAHLYHGEFPLNQHQQEYAMSLRDRTPCGIAVHLADMLGYLIWDRERLEAHARSGTPYSEVEKEERELWEACLTGDMDIHEPFEDFKTPEHDYLRICRETRQEDELAGLVPHADIVIRPLLALAVKKCDTLVDAEQVVKLFYDTFNESASK